MEKKKHIEEDALQKHLLVQTKIGNMIKEVKKLHKEGKIKNIQIFWEETNDHLNHMGYWKESYTLLEFLRMWIKRMEMNILGLRFTANDLDLTKKEERL